VPLFAGVINPGDTDTGGSGGGTGASDVAQVWIEDVGSINATWTDPSGVVWPLSDISDERGHFTTFGIAGWGSMPYELVTDPIARGGESVRFIRPNPARLTWPLHVWGDTHVQFVQRYRALRHAFLLTMHMRRPGLLTVARPDGTARCIEAYYQDGWGGEAGQNWLSASPVLTLYCPDGAWRDTELTTVRRHYGSSANFFSNFPAISSSQVLGDTVISNGGDVTAWPVWTITGPCTGLTATNTTTGQAFQLTTTLADLAQLTITTDRPTVRGPAGENLAGALNWPGAVLWGLQPGDNAVTFTVAGAGANTEIALSYFQRYEGS